ncbi:hypothetical protein D3Y57_02480 (plasmid) [Sphingomonas paeninsulae]|jgi:hypothetical protein|uniref:Uncharacterized protein n=1 Tax=Sphingomonas paeninsulae TaxID=2319844 RepID=A0A494TCG4_SPHPE|nr:hypothetical protein [Sphingomonas paeninsulae]AYJ84944.1 hypothetical protein D3Y57_02480 [Sphingomonas paeninsulae]
MEKAAPKPPRRSKITIPRHAHPIAKLVFSLMMATATTYDVLESRSGVLRQTLKSYRVEKFPSLRSAEALLGSFGWNLTPTPPLSSLSPETLTAIEAISLDFRTDDQVIAAAMLYATTYPKPYSGEGRAPLIEHGHGYWITPELKGQI